MAISLNAKPSPGFDEPLALLSDCHRRIERFLDVLLRVATQSRVAPCPLPADHRQALETALTYFRTAAPRHTEDEERSLFPRMRELNNPTARAALAKLEALEGDHRAAEVDHREVDELGLRWLRDGTLPPDDLDRLVARLEALRAMYRRHIDVEDREVFPLAQSVLPADVVAQVGREMAARRGLNAGGGVGAGGATVRDEAGERSR